jgi:membrane protein
LNFWHAFYDSASDLYRFAVEIYFRFIRHNGFLLAAGIAFFSFLSVFPILLLIGIALSFLFESPLLQQEIIAYVFSRIPSLTDPIKSTIESLMQNRESSGFIALMGLLYAATGLVTSISVALNTIYGVKETRGVVKMRVMALIILLLVLALFIVTFGATILVSVLRADNLIALLPEQLTSIVWTALSYAISFASTLLLFFTIYRFAPNVKVTIHDIWPGTLLVSLALEIEKYVLSIYFAVIGSQSYGLIYGSLSSIIITMFWINVSSMILMLGAEINVLHNERKVKGHA